MSVQVSELFKEFIQGKQQGLPTILPDFSYSGYKYSNEDLPNPTLPIFYVDEFGGSPNDDSYDDEAIQKTIDAAEKNGGGIVQFSAGRYKISPDGDENHVTKIGSSNIVLKGVGSTGNAVTELFIDHMKPVNGLTQIQFNPKKEAKGTVASIVGKSSRGSFTTLVSSTQKMKVGDNVFIRCQSKKLAQCYFKKLGSPCERFTRLFTKGLIISELHCIKEIDSANNIVTFNEPIMFELDPSECDDEGGFTIRRTAMIYECGIEDIKFSSSWVSNEESFSHHLNNIHDYGWEAVSFHGVRNSWMRRCVFESLSSGLKISNSAAITLENLVFEGKKGHFSTVVERGYGVLIRDCDDRSGNFHGPNVGYNAVNTVYQRFRTKPGISLDSHSGNPYASLFDDIPQGGVFSGSGGPVPSYPHHGPDLVLWNYCHRNGKGQKQSYDFWEAERCSKRPKNEFYLPILVGVHGDELKLNEQHCMAIEALGEKVEPSSLFNAQLAYRKRTLNFDFDKQADLKSVFGFYSNLYSTPNETPCNCNILDDPSFDNLVTMGRKFSQWKNFELGFQPSNNGRDGQKGIQVRGVDEGKIGTGAQQDIPINRKQVQTVTFGGYSQAVHNCRICENGIVDDYCLTLALEQEDGSSIVEVLPIAPSKRWVHVEKEITIEKPLIKATFYCLFKNHTGVARFDDMYLILK